MKIVTVIGARPQFVKAAVVSHAIKKHKGVKEVMVHTGQHFDANMSDIFFNQMKMDKPDYMLDINSSCHGEMTGKMLIEIEKVLILERPDFLLVYGDTNSTLAGALAASKLHIPVIHVEAGLRSYNMRMPEEINRVLTDKVSSILFCPTEQSRTNLIKEGYDESQSNIIVTGDVMYDAALTFSKLNPEDNLVKQIVANDEFVLATIHRANNTDNKDKLKKIFSQLDGICEYQKVVMPLHPRTKKAMYKYGITTQVQCIDPVGYVDMLHLLKSCSLVITDSGGLQKEAYFFGKYCITLREETEWVELIEHGYNFLLGGKEAALLEVFDNYKNKTIKDKLELYGDGSASSKVAAYLLSNIKKVIVSV